MLEVEEEDESAQRDVEVYLSIVLLLHDDVPEIEEEDEIA